MKEEGQVAFTEREETETNDENVCKTNQKIDTAFEEVQNKTSYYSHFGRIVVTLTTRKGWRLNNVNMKERTKDELASYYLVDERGKQMMY